MKLMCVYNTTHLLLYTKFLRKMSISSSYSLHDILTTEDTNDIPYIESTYSYVSTTQISATANASVKTLLYASIDIAEFLRETLSGVNAFSIVHYLIQWCQCEFEACNWILLSVWILCCNMTNIRTSYPHHICIYLHQLLLSGVEWYGYDNL
jgi:hypothetical protein